MKRYLRFAIVLMLFQGCSAQKNSQLIDAEMETVVSESLSYYLYFPKDYKKSPQEYCGMTIGDNPFYDM